MSVKREGVTTNLRTEQAIELHIRRENGTAEIMTITLIQKSGKSARICIDAPDCVSIPVRLRRKELTVG